MLCKKSLIIGGTILVVSLIGLSGWQWWTLTQSTVVPRAVPESQFRPLLQSLNQPTPTPTPKIVLKDIPIQKNLTGGIQVFQTFNNCGPASLSMALSHYGISQSQAVLGQSLRPWQNSNGDNDDKSVTLAELALKAEEFGFTAYHRPGGSVELIKHFINYDMPVITRTWLMVDESIGHYRVVTGFDESAQILIQDDSLQGAQLSYAYNDYLQLWQAFNYEFLVLVPSDKIDIAEAILGDISDETIAWQKALELANKQISQNPDNVYAHFNKSVGLYHLDRYAEAIEVYERIEARLPFRMLWYQNEPIMAYYKNKNYDRVLSLSNQIIGNHNRAYAELYQLRGQIYRERNQTDLAQQAFALASQYGSVQEYWRVNIK